MATSFRNLIWQELDLMPECGLEIKPDPTQSKVR